MSEFYEIMSRDLFLSLQRTKRDLFPLECMICYEECTLATPIVMLPCFHILHEECAKNTIEMAFRNAIHPNTTLCTWEFHCPQKDSIDSLSEQGRIIHHALGRHITPSIPRCLHIPIPNREVQYISYFSLPYVQQWYQCHIPKQTTYTMTVLILFMIVTVMVMMMITPLFRMVILTYMMYQAYCLLCYHVHIVKIVLKIMFVSICVTQILSI
jgi:hypothetical protein